jgi:hypothetical protein
MVATPAIAPFDALSMNAGRTPNSSRFIPIFSNCRYPPYRIQWRQGAKRRCARDERFGF